MTMPCDPTLKELIEGRRAMAGHGPDDGFGYDIDLSTPQIAVAIHAGHHVHDELLPMMALSSAQRLFEEDAGTDFMIQGCSNAVWGRDSRAVYDLNRPPDAALPLTPEQFWGVKVYRQPPSPKTNRRNLARHEAFYLFMGTVISCLLERFGQCIVYDIHSYNITRQQDKGFESPPVFNLGTAALDRERWEAPIESWLEALKAIRLPGIETTVAENLVFSGKGELCLRLTRWDPRILVLPTEVSKVYMDELSGALYPKVVRALRTGLQQAMGNHLQ